MLIQSCQLESWLRPGVMVVHRTELNRVCLDSPLMSLKRDRQTPLPLRLRLRLPPPPRSLLALPLLYAALPIHQRASCFHSSLALTRSPVRLSFDARTKRPLRYDCSKRNLPLPPRLALVLLSDGTLLDLVNGRVCRWRLRILMILLFALSCQDPRWFLLRPADNWTKGRLPLMPLLLPRQPRRCENARFSLSLTLI